MTLLDDYLLAEPGWLWLLLLVPAALFLGYRQGTRSWIAYPTLRVLSTLGWKPKDQLSKFAPLLVPLALVPAIIGMARPQEAKTRTVRTASGIDIVIALDVSESMAAADFFEDSRRMRSSVRRIDAAKKIITRFIQGRPDDRIGIVSFAARPYTIAPITLDHQILAGSLRKAELVRSRTEGGTAIGSALVAAGYRLDQLEHEGEDDERVKSKSKIIVLVTDGASNSGELKPLQASRLVADLGIKVYTVAIGSESGRIPGFNAGQEFDPETLKKIAAMTGGDYYRARDYSGLREAFQSINQLEKTEIKQQTWTNRKELYPWFMGASAFILLGSLIFTAFNPPSMP
jgi:Ca-activated chloride channel family protein